MDLVKEELDGFKAAVTSMRWFLTTAILISVLIILHIWLEKVGYQDHQLQNIFSHRITGYTLEIRKCYEDMAHHLQRISDGLEKKDSSPSDSCNDSNFPTELKEEIHNDIKKPLHEFLSIYSGLEYNIMKTDNTLKNERFQVRKVPLLGVEVPANDFVTVMAIMSLIFTAGVLLNLRAINAALMALKGRNEPGLIEACKLHLAFVTSLDSLRGDTLARGVRVLAIWLPFVSILLGTLLGYSDIRLAFDEHGKYFLGELNIIGLHIFVAGLVIMLHLAIALESSRSINEIDSTLQSSISAVSNNG
jgi:hypothetical protein